MQVGEADLLEGLFPESRFNSWVVGEIHILDQRILPNGRRDHFEQNVHFRNVLSELAPLARDLVRRCRSSSVRRNWLRQFEQGVAYIRERNKVLRQAAITKAQRGRFQQEIEQRLLKMEKIASHPTLEAESQLLCCRRLKQLRGSLAQVLAEKSQHRRLRTLRGPQKRLAQRLIDLIYEVSPSQTSARMIVEKILKRL
jgi:molecular chaperone HtpG